MKRSTFLKSLLGIAIAPSILVSETKKFEKFDTLDITPTPATILDFGDYRIYSAGENIECGNLVTEKYGYVFNCNRDDVICGVSMENIPRYDRGRIKTKGEVNIRCSGI